MKFKCTYVEQEVFEGIKKIAERYVLILFTDFNKHLDIQTDMRNYQLRVMINHDK